MKKILIAALTILGSTLLAQQTPPPPAKQKPEEQKARKEKMEALRVGYITRALDLTTEEAQKFWPVFNEFHKKRDELARKHREGMKMNIDSMNDKDAEKWSDETIIFRQQELDLVKEYHAKFKSVLPPKKVARLYEAEKQMTLRMMQMKGKMMKEKRPLNGVTPPPPPPPPGK